MNGAKGVQAPSADVAPTQLDLDDEDMSPPGQGNSEDAEMPTENKGAPTEIHSAKASTRKDNIPYPNPEIDQVTVSKVSISAI